SGWTSTRTPPSRPVPRPSTSFARRPRWSASSGPTRAPRKTNPWPEASDRAGAGPALRGVNRVRLLAERAGLGLGRRRLLDERLRDLPDDEGDHDEGDDRVDEGPIAQVDPRRRVAGNRRRLQLEFFRSEVHAAQEQAYG